MCNFSVMADTSPGDRNKLLPVRVSSTNERVTDTAANGDPSDNLIEIKDDHFGNQLEGKTAFSYPLTEKCIEG